MYNIESLQLIAFARDVGVLANPANTFLPILAVRRWANLPLAESVTLVVRMAGAWKVAALADSWRLPVFTIRALHGAFTLDVTLRASGGTMSEAGVVGCLSVADHELSWQEMVFGGRHVDGVGVEFGMGGTEGNDDEHGNENRILVRAQSVTPWCWHKVALNRSGRARRRTTSTPPPGRWRVLERGRGRGGGRELGRWEGGRRRCTTLLRREGYRSSP